jgi:acyl-CoA thioesterase YciA
MSEKISLPANKQPTLRVITKPNDANPKGDIFGGWLMSQIDIAGAIAAISAAKGPVSTVAVKELQFIRPLYAHDIVSFYTEVIAIGTTSITVAIEVYTERYMGMKDCVIKVSDAVFVYVAVSEPGKKRKISK